MRREQESNLLRKMIRLYCRSKHSSRPDELCAECAEMLAYAETRLAHCPFRDAKPTCRRCEIHCYCPEMRARIAVVMRFAGPRMLVRHPVLVLRHMFPKKR